jgi:hypothetical protein
VATADLSGGFSSFKTTVYNFVENFFGWLSTHQSLALILILIILGIMLWLILRVKKYGKQLDEKISSKNIEIGKKDALIEEHKNKLEALQKKLSDQQGVVGEALTRTLTNITGYDLEQLKIFFKFLTKISGNPLQIADSQAITLPKRQQLEKVGDDSIEENDKKEKNIPDSGPKEVVKSDKSDKE